MPRRSRSYSSNYVKRHFADIFCAALLNSQPANCVICPTLFERRRRFALGAWMMAINGCIQRLGGVVQLVAQQIFDRSADRMDWRIAIRRDELTHDTPSGQESRE